MRIWFQKVMEMMNLMKMDNKLRGGYYTPPEIAKFLVSWSLNGSEKCRTMLEPSMGDGAFILPIVRELTRRGFSKSVISKSVYGIELLNQEVRKVKTSLKEEGYNPESFNLINDDFFSVIDSSLRDKQFDIILGNPPFIRYQNFPEAQRKMAIDILSKNGFHPNKLTNAWLLFLLVSILHLNEEGKLAMVIPAELLQVGYAAETRVFLSNFFHSITIITFKKLAFQGIQQEVVLLLCDKSKKSPNGINLVELYDSNQLPSLSEIKSPSKFKPIDHDTDKWTQYFLDRDEILLLRKLKRNEKISRLGKLLEVDVGVVTGNNDFFVVNKETVENYQLQQHVIPLVGRSAQLNGGFNFTEKKWNELRDGNNQCFLFSFDDPIEKTLPVGVEKYLKIGKKNAVPEGYKCRVRKMWQSVPSVWIPDAFLFRQIHLYPRMVLNESNAVSTDTIHRVRFKNNINKEKLMVSFHNSLTFAFCEVLGRSYGGGVLELEPSEAEDLPIPYLSSKSTRLKKMEEIVKKGGIEAWLDYADNKLLHEGLKLSKNELVMLRQIWNKLSQRRIKRKESKK